MSFCHVNMLCKRSIWSRVPLTKQLKRDIAGNGEATINNAATVIRSGAKNIGFDIIVCYCLLYFVTIVERTVLFSVMM